VRGRLGLGLAVVALLASGCGHDPDDGQNYDGKSAESLPWRDIGRATPGTTTPSPLTGLPSLLGLAAAAVAGRSRIDGERFAMTLAQAVLDVREKPRGEDILGVVAGSELPAATAAYVTFDVDMQSVDGGRQVDLASGMWIRSRVIGQQTESDRINVELILMVTAPRTDTRFWDGNRFDVVWESGRWRLADYRASMPGVELEKGPLPTTSGVLSEPGWRRISPSH
jgi:hypothetical protein